MTGDHSLSSRTALDEVSDEFRHHSSAQRVSTDVVIVDALRRKYPQLKLTIAPDGNADLLAYAAAGHAHVSPVQDIDAHTWRQYAPPARRLDNQTGGLVNVVHFGKYSYSWNGYDFILYIVNGRDGMTYFPQIINQYILSTTEQIADDLILNAAKYNVALHDEVWVFDQGYWQKNRELWQSVQKWEWEDVILDEEMKEAIIRDTESFFDSRDTYESLKVPWKRGIIYYGPPGNGKTTSIKAMMHSLYKRKDAVPTLYVKTLASLAGPEYALRQIFLKARQQAPCYLVFEDLDSIVSDRVRSYFLNEVDGLARNDGILMVGSTNHLENLDPGISKRPSRFDRKYLFPDPEYAQRAQYCQYWQKKLASNKNIEFPDALCAAIATITDKFSFAYIQEAFVAALLVIAGGSKTSNSGGGDGDDELERLVLWREIKRQVKILRDQMDGEGEGSGQD